MKEKLIAFVVKNKSLLVKGGLIVGLAIGTVVAAGIVINKMSDPEVLMDGIVSEENPEQALAEE